MSVLKQQQPSSTGLSQTSTRPPFREWRLKHRIKIARRQRNGPLFAELCWQLGKLKARKAGKP